MADRERGSHNVQIAVAVIFTPPAEWADVAITQFATYQVMFRFSRSPLIIVIGSRGSITVAMPWRRNGTNRAAARACSCRSIPEKNRKRPACCPARRPR